MSTLNVLNDGTNTVQYTLSSKFKQWSIIVAKPWSKNISFHSKMKQFFIRGKTNAKHTHNCSIQKCQSHKKILKFWDWYVLLEGYCLYLILLF